MGNMYGTTYTGGTNGRGCVYKLDTAGTETVVYNFTGGSDGGLPFAGLTLDLDGNLYGTTAYGGAFNFGTVYEVNTAGIETVLHSFEGGSDGATPHAAVVRDSVGDLYGTTYYGGSANLGTLFRISSDGTETLLHVFLGGGKDNDALEPTGDLTRDSDGNLYGTTYGPGGVVFKLGITH